MTERFFEQSLTRHDKTEILQHSSGFVPQSPRELNEAFSLLSFDPVKHAGAAGHLNEILVHQQYATTENPQKAVRSVVKEYAG